MVKSMTAFARQEKKLSWGSIALELRSVNHRFLEMSIRMPEELRTLEMSLREQLKSQIKRGKLDLVIRLEMHAQDNGRINFNAELAEQVSKTLHEIDKLIYNAAPVNAIDVLNWPGVMIPPEFDQDEVKADLVTLLDAVLNDFSSAKEREGSALKQMILQRCEQLSQCNEEVRNNMPEIMQAQRERLEERLASLQAGMDLDRLEQEMVFIAQKADVAEEIDRLDTHLKEIQRVLESNDAMGRRLDFLMQELNREANTLASKSIAHLTTQVSVDMKVLIEQMREQIQNIE